MTDKREKDVEIMDRGEIIHSRASLKYKLVAAVANGDEIAARELRFLLKMDKPEVLKGTALKRKA
jgi:hypothetical protein